ncbi:MAG: hypothetical protein V9E82_04770 [Candidatus Nanopelagicales bacterium]
MAKALGVQNTANTAVLEEGKWQVTDDLACFDRERGDRRVRARVASNRLFAV